jgi:hypothetical protein
MPFVGPVANSASAASRLNKATVFGSCSAQGLWKHLHKAEEAFILIGTGRRYPLKGPVLVAAAAPPNPLSWRRPAVPAGGASRWGRFTVSRDTK